MPSAVAKLTVTGAAWAALSETVKTYAVVPLLPSLCETSLIVMFDAAASSLTIVPTPWASVIVALPVAPERFTLNVSFGSTVVSPLTCTVTVCEVTPGAKVTVPEFAV